MLKMFRKKNNQKGFTLMELMVVIGIIAILALIAIPVYQNAQASARGAKVEADLRSIDSALTIATANGETVTEMKNLTDKNYMASTPAPPPDGLAIRFSGGTEDVTAAGAAYKITIVNGVLRATYMDQTVEKLSTLKKPTT